MPLAAALHEECRRQGLEAILVDTNDFLRPASVRYERGRDDPDAFFEDWLDVDALRREVLEPLGPRGSRRYLPTLWDARLDRATRAPYRTAGAAAIVIVHGELLLGRDLPFDVTVHLAMSPAARRRKAPPEVASREMPAFDRYDEQVRPLDLADVVVRCDDPRHLAVGSVTTG